MWFRQAQDQATTVRWSAPTVQEPGDGGRDRNSGDIDPPRQVGRARDVGGVGGAAGAEDGAVLDAVRRRWCRRGVMPRAPAKAASTGPALGRDGRGRRGATRRGLRGGRAEQGGEEGGEARAGQVEYVVEAGRRPSRTPGSADCGGRPWRRGCWPRDSQQPRYAEQTRPSTSGATTASEVFSATDSTTARAISCSSRVLVSRPTRWVRRCRAGGVARRRAGRPPRRLALEGGATEHGPGRESGGEQRLSALEHDAGESGSTDERGGVGGTAGPGRRVDQSLEGAGSRPEARPPDGTGPDRPARGRPRSRAGARVPGSRHRHEQGREAELDRGTVDVTGHATEAAYGAPYQHPHDDDGQCHGHDSAPRCEPHPGRDDHHHDRRQQPRDHRRERGDRARVRQPEPVGSRGRHLRSGR